MKVTPIKTHKITASDTSLTAILDKYIPTLKEKSILAITSKIVSITEGRIVKMGSIDKDTLVKQEAQYYLPKEENKYGFFLTIKNGIMIASAGIDESNGNGYYILWPKNPQQTANQVREYLGKKFGVRDIGVIITDSKVTPLRRGVTGITLAYSGFVALKNYIDTPDIFGKKLRVTYANIADGLATSSVLCMGEGKEQTPLAIVHLPGVRFVDRNPTQKELLELKISLKEDIFGSMLQSVKWKKGGS